VRRQLDPNLDLALERVIKASPGTVWTAWTDPSQLEQWWLPAPTRCRVEQLDVAPGGAFVTSLSDDGVEFVPHLDACFLVVDELERIVFTNAVDSRWRPARADPVAMTAEVVMREHPDGTSYRVTVLHGDAGSRASHERLGFLDGWGSVTSQLAAFCEGGGCR
jgi:uncharacterized protein YndB with AHSA1/START domain